VGGVITVRASKGRTRIVPIHPTTVNRLRSYAAAHRRLLPGARDDAFFVSELGKGMCSETLDWNYGEACEAAEIARDDDGRPRLHDLRHRFAIRTLERWFRCGDDVDTRMEELATFLGHSHPAHTYWYLSATPELLRLAERRARDR
jgi:integrase